MKKSHLLAIIALVSLTSCGDNSPFDKDYWDDPKVKRDRNSAEETPPPPTTTSTSTYTAVLTTLSSINLGDIAGTANININETDVSSTLTLSDVPQSLMIGQRSLSTSTCAEIAASFPPPSVITTLMEFKSVNEVDNSSREALIAELNQADPQNGDAINLVGKSYVIKAYVENLNTPGPTTATLIPIACGTISANGGGGDSEEEDPGETIGGSTTGGDVGGETLGGTTTGF